MCALLVSVTLWAQSDAFKEFGKKYDRKGYEVSTVGRTAIRMAALAGDKESREMMRKFDLLVSIKREGGDDDALHEDFERLVDGCLEHFGGGFDFVLHSVGMSPNIRKQIPYTALNYDYMSKTLDVSALSFHKILQVLHAKDALRDWASVVALTYLAAERAVVGYGDMAEAKAMLQSIARSFGAIYGRERHVRINTVSQSPTMTTAGSGIEGMQRMYDYADGVAPLGNASADDCANYIVTLFSDLTRKVTMQNLYHDGGFSSMGMSRRAMKVYKKGMQFDDVSENKFPFGVADKE